MATSVVHKLELVSSVYSTTVTDNGVRMVHWNFGCVGIIMEESQVMEVLKNLENTFDVDTYKKERAIANPL